MTCYGLFVLQPGEWLQDTKLCFQGPGGAYGTKADIWSFCCWLLVGGWWWLVVVVGWWLFVGCLLLFLLLLLFVVVVLDRRV